MDSVKGSGHYEVVIARELIQAGVEFAVVDKTTSFVDNEESEDNHDCFVRVPALQAVI